MSKIHGTSKLLALTLIASIATFGCTTNWTRSDGEPATGSTNVGTPSATPGTSGGTTYPQPMISSSQIPQRTPDQALAVMQQSRPAVPQGIVLGPVNPPMTGEARIGGYNTATPGFTGQIRQLTVNSSIANPWGPQPVVVSGAGETLDAAALFGDIVIGNPATTSATNATIGTVNSPTIGVVAGATPATTAAATTSSPTTFAGATSPTATAASITATTPTSAAIPLTTGVFSAATGTLTPSASSAAVPVATVSTSPVVLGNTGMLSSSSITNDGTVVVTAPATSAGATFSPGTVRSNLQAPLRLNRSAVTSTKSTSAITVTQGANGKLVISNVK